MKSIILIIMLFSVVLLNSKDKSSVMKELKSKYSSPKSVSLQFFQENSDNISGNIIALEGNKYRITIPGRIITSNGKSIWNYSYNENNVIISNFSSHTDNASPEKVFFSVIDKYKPKELVKVSSSNDKSFFKMILVPTDEVISEMTEITLWLSKDYDISKVGIKSIFGFEIWRISDLKVNLKINESEFVFSPPEGTEVIDLR